jgi:pimeloyl-ACP methyl ester carboxylesterase
MVEVQLNDLRFHVVDEGEGLPVVLLHGFPDTSDLWRSQIDALATAGYRAIAPDMRGRGRSDKPEGVGQYAIPLIVGDVIGIMDKLGVTRAHVVGHDWGAVPAWAIGSLLPDRVDHLVAISVGHPGAFRKPSLEALQKGWYRLLVQFDGAEELLQADDWYLLRTLLQDTPMIDTYIQTLSEPGALTAGLNWYRANLPPESLLGSPNILPSVQAPTLGIFGTGDLYLTEDAMTRSSESVTGPWRYERFEGTSHWVPLEEPERLNRLLLEFFAT